MEYGIIFIVFLNYRRRDIHNVYLTFFWWNLKRENNINCMDMLYIVNRFFLFFDGTIYEYDVQIYIDILNGFFFYYNTDRKMHFFIFYRFIFTRDCFFILMESFFTINNNIVMETSWWLFWISGQFLVFGIVFGQNNKP